jgi:secreted PhoX family phosphatase
MTTRRGFLRTLTLAAGTLAAPGVLEMACARVESGKDLASPGYGPLVPDPDGLLELPAGFSYRVFSTAMLGTEGDERFSQRLSDDQAVPAMHDGMCALPGPDGGTILIRNHEIEPGAVPAVAPGRGPRYDPLGTGGTTNLWVDRDGKLLRSFASLAGTFRNCAGGATPWGTWLTAEECTYTPGAPDLSDYDRRPDVVRPHGYVFEVDSRAEGLVAPIPTQGMGRFNHEAVVVDPETGYVYLTEDRDDGLLYRYRPAVVTEGRKPPAALATGDLAQGGALEALRVVDHPRAATQNWGVTRGPFRLGRALRVDWIPIERPDPPVDTEPGSSDVADPVKQVPHAAPGSTRWQGRRLGAASFARNEGITLIGRVMYFCSTTGGRARAGQVWKLDPARSQLTLVLEPNDRNRLDGPDNLAPAPNGDLLVCEDGTGEQFVRGLTPRGTLYRLARNALNLSELAGACFSPDQRILFVNIQNPGMTFAIQGPWDSRKA